MQIFKIEAVDVVLWLIKTHVLFLTNLGLQNEILYNICIIYEAGIEMSGSTQFQENVRWFMAEI